MRRKPALIVGGLVLLAFALGVGVGSRFTRRAVVYDDESVLSKTASASPDRPPAESSSVATTASLPACVDIRNAERLVGKSGCVAGLVLRVYAARSGNTFLDFCQDYRACPFTSIIFAADSKSFGDLGTLQGKRVEIRGKVVSYRGHAEIVIRDARQIRGAP
jgi:hypothetical protein